MKVCLSCSCAVLFVLPWLAAATCVRRRSFSSCTHITSCCSSRVEHFYEQACYLHIRQSLRTARCDLTAYLQACYGLISRAKPSAELLLELNKLFLSRTARLLSSFNLSAQFIILFLHRTVDDCKSGQLALICFDPGQPALSVANSCPL